LNKKHPKNTEFIAEALGHLIFKMADKDIYDLEHNEEFKESAAEFNKLSRLKRLLDLYIIYFWEINLQKRRRMF